MTDISLREYIEARLAAIRLEMDWRATEIDRRLGELNHAHQQHLDMISRTVPRENWEQRNKEIDERIEIRSNTVDTKFANGMSRFEKMEKAIAVATAAAHGKSNGISSSWAVIVTVATLALAVIAIYLKT